VLQLQSGGSASFANVTAAHVGASTRSTAASAAASPSPGSGNSGWYTATPYCGPWPAPVYTYPAAATRQPPRRHHNHHHYNNDHHCAERQLALARPCRPAATPRSTVPATPMTTTPAATGKQQQRLPAVLQVDLGSSTVGAPHRAHPPVVHLVGARTETLSVLVSTDGSSFATVVGTAATGRSRHRQHRDHRRPRTSQRFLRSTSPATTAGRPARFGVPGIRILNRPGRIPVAAGDPA